jgi:hypothetical protein
MQPVPSYQGPKGFVAPQALVGQAIMRAMGKTKPVATTGFSPLNFAKDLGIGAGLSTIGTTGGLLLTGALAGKRAPIIKKMFNNAAKESLLFFNPVRSYKLIRRLPEAANLAKRQMDMNNELMGLNLPSQKNFTELNAAFRNMPNAPEMSGHYDRVKALVDATQAFNKAHGELPMDTLEKGIGVVNGAMNLGVGAVAGAAPQLISSFNKESSVGYLRKLANL